MYYLNDYDEERKKEFLVKVNNYIKDYESFNKTELLEIFNDLLCSFSKEKIFYPYLEYNNNYTYNTLSFSTTTRDASYEEKLEKVKDFDFNISFSHNLEQYDIKYSQNKNENKEYINITIYSCTKININNYMYNNTQPKKEFYANDKKIFELIIYSKDSIFIKIKNEKIIPFKLSNIMYYSDNIFKILLSVFSKYSPIYKDILRESFLLSYPFTFLNIGLDELNNCYNKKQLLEKIFDIKLFNSINSFSLYEGYIICCALKLVKENYYCNIYNFAKELKMQRGFTNGGFSFIGNSKKEIGFKFLSLYYLKNFKENNFMSNISHEIYRFIEYEYKIKKYIDVNINSIKKIKEYAFLYNIISDAKKRKSFTIKNKNNFNELELPNGFKRIKSKKELIELSQKTKINFFNDDYYYEKFKNDKYAIYTIKINSDLFTVIIKETLKYNSVNNKNHKFSLIKIQTTNNSKIPLELYNDINSLIKYNNKHKLGGFINEL